MDAKVVQLVETEVLIRGSSGADLDSSPRQVEDREYENHVACEQTALRVKLVAKGVDQELEYEPGFSVPEHLEDRAEDDAHEVDADVEDVKDMQEQAANTEAVESLEEQEVDQDLVKKMDAKTVPIVGTEVRDDSIGGSSGEDLNSGQRQGGHRVYGNHAAYEQRPFHVKSSVPGVKEQRYEPGSSVSDHMEHIRTGDYNKVDPMVGNVKGVQEEVAITVAGEMPKEQEVDQELVSGKMDPELISVAEKEVPDVSIEGSPELDSCPRQTEDRKYGDRAIYELSLLPVQSFDEGADHKKNLEHKTTGDNDEVDTGLLRVKEVQEEAADTEAVELPKEQEVDQELVSEKLDANLVPIVEKVLDVSLGGSQGLDSSPRLAGDGDFGGLAANARLPLPVNSFDDGGDREREYESGFSLQSSDEGVDHGREYAPGSSVVKHLDHRTVDSHVVDKEMEGVKEAREEAAYTETLELPKEQEVDQELVSEKMDAEVAPIVEKEVFDIPLGGSQDLDLGPRQAGEREFRDRSVYEQPPLPAESFDKGGDCKREHEPGCSVAEHLEHIMTGGNHEVNTEIKEVREGQEEAANMEAVELPKEQEIPASSIGGSPGMDSDPREAGDREYGEHAAYEQPPLPIKSLDEGVDQELEYEPSSPALSCIEHRATVDILEVDTEMEDVKEVQEEAVDTEAPESPEERVVDQELSSERRDAEVMPVAGKKVHDVCNGGSPDMESCHRQADDRQYANHATYGQPSSPVKSFDKGANHAQEYKSGSSVISCLEPRETIDFHEVDAPMKDVNEKQEQAAQTEAVELPNEPKILQELDHKLLDENIFPILETEAPDVSIGCSGVADTGSSPRQAGDHAAYEQLSSPVKSFNGGADHGQEYEPGSSVAECLELGASGDTCMFDTNVENVIEVQEHAANTKDVELSAEQKGDRGLVCKEMDAKLAPLVETEAPNISTGDSPTSDLFFGPKVVGDREHGDGSAYEQPSLPVKPFVKGVDDALECESASAGAEHQEHEATDAVGEADTNEETVQLVQEEVANAESVGSRKEQIVDQELDYRNMDVEMDPIRETYVLDVSSGGSLGVDLDSGPRQAREYGDHDVCEQPLPAMPSVEGVGQGLEYEAGSSVDDHLEHRATAVHEVDTSIDDQEMQEGVSTESKESAEEQEDQELVSYAAKARSKEEKHGRRSSLKPGSLMKDHRVSYQLQSENEGEFAVFDLVWGKVKSHPWWPGQIFHPSDSSEKAMKYYRKDCYLVAYFGDRTFAWNEASVLKPFRNHFPQAERQNKSEAFQNAVSCALEEVERRVELGLACSCLSEEAYDKIKYQIVENTGIREESSKREGVDRSTGVDSFQPEKLTEYLRALALFPTSGVDRLEIVIAKSQLLAFNRLKGCDALPEFHYYEGLAEYDADMQMLDENVQADSVTRGDAKKGPHKRKHNLKDIVYQRRKEKSITELMGESMYCLDGEFDSHEEDDIILTSPIAGTKRKASGFLTDDSKSQRSTKTISLAKVSHAASPNPQQSFKVGECIRRVANQLTGSSAIIKSCSEGSNNKRIGDDADEVSEPPDDDLTESVPSPSVEASLDEMLSQLHLSARDPMKRYSYLADIIRFFSEFRDLAVTTRRQKMRKGSGRKKKSSVPVVGSPETFEFDDRNDSYWTDMVVQNNAEAKPARRGRKRKNEQVVSGDPEKTLKPNRRKYSRKQYHVDKHESTTETPTGDEKKLDLPTELMMNFGEMGSIPSEVNLNKIFRRFGPLKESETGVDMQSSRARVVFKKRSDAEVAYSSAAMFNIFGSTPVNYQLNYTPASFSTLPLALTDGKEDAT